MNLIYVSHWRFPSEKTHSRFAMKTCEAFAQAGIPTVLWAANRRDTSRGDPFLVHEVKKNFSITFLPVLDLMHILPGKIGFYLLVASFNISVFFFAIVRSISKDTLFYFHDARDAFFFSFLRKPFFLEMHDFYKSRLSFINRFVFKRARGIIATNRLKIREIIKEFRIPLERLLYQPNAVDVGLFSGETTIHEARRILLLPFDKKVIVYTGSLFDWKGSDLLLALHSFLRGDEVLYIVGGTDDDIARLKHFLVEKGVQNIVLVGRKPLKDIPMWQQAADILLLPNSARFDASKYETSPVKLFEYMASGRPIVASDLPSVRDIVDENIVFFATADDPSSFARAIHAVLDSEDKGAERARAAREFAKKYSWDERAVHIVDFLQRT